MEQTKTEPGLGNARGGLRDFSSARGPDCLKPRAFRGSGWFPGHGGDVAPPGPGVAVPPGTAPVSRRQHHHWGRGCTSWLINMPGERGLFQEAPGCLLAGDVVLSQGKCQSPAQREQWVLQLSGVPSPNSRQHLGVFFSSRSCLNMSIFVRGEQGSEYPSPAPPRLPLNDDALPLQLPWCSTKDPSPARHCPAALSVQAWC